MLSTGSNPEEDMGYMSISSGSLMGDAPTPGHTITHNQKRMDPSVVGLDILETWAT